MFTATAAAESGTAGKEARRHRRPVRDMIDACG
jgi:hypothetical protein